MSSRFDAGLRELENSIEDFRQFAIHLTVFDEHIAIAEPLANAYKNRIFRDLRDRLLPLLELLARFSGNPPYDELHEEAEEILSTWQTKG